MIIMYFMHVAYNLVVFKKTFFMGLTFHDDPMYILRLSQWSDVKLFVQFSCSEHDRVRV
jgi:hypothetical protein